MSNVYVITYYTKLYFILKLLLRCVTNDFFITKYNARNNGIKQKNKVM